MADTSWAAHLDVATGKYYRPTVALTGPGLDDLVRLVAEMLADSIHDRDGRADAWTDYVLAVGNLKAADDAERPDREVDVADAWSALEAELPNAVRLPLVEACAVGRLLDRTASGALHEIGQRP
jgi:hypothetical protein